MVIGQSALEGLGINPHFCYYFNSHLDNKYAGYRLIYITNIKLVPHPAIPPNASPAFPYRFANA